MDIQAEKLELITWLTQVNDAKVIREIKAIRKERSTDWWDELTESNKEDIEAGLRDLRAGRKKEISEVLGKYK